LVDELFEFVDDVVDDLNSRDEVNYLRTILKMGTGADRQLKVFDENGGDLKKVVDYIVQETNEGLD
jgi:carboxylate-amine ligase